MAQTVAPMPFESFLQAAVRLKDADIAPTYHAAVDPQGKEVRRKKVGLALDENLIDQVHDYVHAERKHGHKVTMTEVYENALREYLSSHAIEARYA